MSQENITREQVDTAFKKLKRFVYYDKNDLSLRRRVARFERSNTFAEDLDELYDVVNSDDIVSEAAFLDWLGEIRYRVVPKKIKPDENVSLDGSGTFITNRTSSAHYVIASVNYFFDGPVQLHLLAVLWVMLDGRYLDATLGAECYGARLERLPENGTDTSARLYQRYHPLYKRWRDAGIAKAKHMLSEERKSVCILGLDIKEYYYHVAIDYKEVFKTISKEVRGSAKNAGAVSKMTGLLSAIEHIGRRYKKKISASLATSHPSVPKDSQGLPIGLLSSQLLANWYLKGLDVAMTEEIRPAYYGRYVDDILLVVPAPARLSDNAPIEHIMEKLFVKTGLLAMREEGVYETLMRPGLILQKDKCVLQFFDANHSIAGLAKFQKTLEANGSDFLLMPVDEADSSLEDVAYELLFDGSTNKFRNVKGIAENRYGLAKYLGRQTMLSLLTAEQPDRVKNTSVINFFRGRSAIEFHDLWERVFTLLLVSEDTVAFKKFETNMRAEIERVGFPTIKLQEKIRKNLHEHLDLSISMALALTKSEKHDSLAAKFRRSNLLRHHFVRVPLVNYTDYKGSLITRDIPQQLKISDAKLKLSPRFINFDECMLLVMSGNLKDHNIEEGTHAQHFTRARNIFERANLCQLNGVVWSAIHGGGTNNGQL